jgi:hypothetical protein
MGGYGRVYIHHGHGGRIHRLQRQTAKGDSCHKSGF